jgi:hypothetical protein
MAVPDGYKTPEEIAVELKQTYNRIMTAIRELYMVPTIFPDDRRRRYYSPDDIRKIKEWIENR